MPSSSSSERGRDDGQKVAPGISQQRSGELEAPVERLTGAWEELASGLL